MILSISGPWRLHKKTFCFVLYPIEHNIYSKEGAMGYIYKIRRLFRKVVMLAGRAGGELQPMEILSKIVSEMESRKKHGIDENAFVPNIYTVSLSTADYEELNPLLAGIREQIRRKVMERIQKEDYKLLSDSVSLVIREDPALKKNEVAVESCFEKTGSAVRVVEKPAISDPKGQSNGKQDAGSAGSSATKIGEDNKTRLIEGPGIQLEVIEGEGKGQVIPLGDGEHTFGRGKDAVVLVRDPEETVSRVHFKISVKDGRVSIRDLNSTNGTRVNNEEVEEAEIKQGDTIAAGKVALRVV